MPLTDTSDDKNAEEKNQINKTTVVNAFGFNVQFMPSGNANYGRSYLNVKAYGKAERVYIF